MGPATLHGRCATAIWVNGRRAINGAESGKRGPILMMMPSSVSGRLKEVFVYLLVNSCHETKNTCSTIVQTPSPVNLDLGIFVAAPGPLLSKSLHPELRARRAEDGIRSRDTDPPKLMPTLHLKLHQYDPVGKYKCFVLPGPEPRRGTALFRSAVGPQPD